MVIAATRHDLLGYYGARNCATLERQFNRDGRLIPILIDGHDDKLLVATGGKQTYEVLSTFTFPLRVSDLLGQIEIDRRTAEALAMQ